MFLYFQIAALSFDPDEDENEEEEEKCDIEIKKEVEDTSLKKKRLGEQS